MASVGCTSIKGTMGAQGVVRYEGAFRRRPDGDGEKPPGLGQHYGSMVESWIVCTMCFFGRKDVGQDLEQQN